jgi:hypothetical protein
MTYIVAHLRQVVLRIDKRCRRSAKHLRSMLWRIQIPRHVDNDNAFVAEKQELSL